MMLADYLKANNLSEAIFAEMIDTSQPTVHRLKHGNSWPGREVAERIFVATGGAVTPNDFMRKQAGETDGTTEGQQEQIQG